MRRIKSECKRSRPEAGPAALFTSRRRVHEGFYAGLLERIRDRPVGIVGVF
jgi:hypothetical protein